MMRCNKHEATGQINAFHKKITKGKILYFAPLHRWVKNDERQD
jgi:hypothetical protein